MKLYRFITVIVTVLSINFIITGQQCHRLVSPDGRISISISIGSDKSLYYSLDYNGDNVILPSSVSMHLDNGYILGKKITGRIKVKKENVNDSLVTPFYRQSSIKENYNSITLTFNNKYAVEFRAYDEGFAYRFKTAFDEHICVENEEATFRFNKDYQIYIPYSNGKDNPFNISFENRYTEATISDFDIKRYSMTPLAIKLDGGHNMIITESDLRHYPGMFLKKGEGNSLEGAFAPIPDEIETDGIRKEEKIVSYTGILSEGDGRRSYPWRILAIAENDKDMPVNNMVYLLGEECRIKDTDWIKPGRAVWDWWNNWGLTGVDFKPGINTETYKFHIDFAAANGLEYIIIDEGWYNPASGDMLTVIPGLDLKELIEYGNSKNVGIILWCVSYVLDYDMEKIFSTYSGMGIKGFKTDFLNRDDMQAVDLTYRILEMAAKYRMVIDMHGMYKPTGLNRTYPNLLNYEGVWGLEQMKWSDEDMIGYDVTFPFIRMMAGPVDYTQGAMRNGLGDNFKVSYDNPMSQGTRAHQVAEYIVFDSPLVMLADSPTAYIQEKETTDFISSIPTVFEETRILDGEIGKFIITARRNGDTWYIGGLNGHEKRTVELDLSFIQDEENLLIFKDRINTNNIGKEYIMDNTILPKNKKIYIDVSEGGGFGIITGKRTNDRTEVVLNNIATRISVRKFTGSSVDNDTIFKILKAGMSAPTAKNSQPWVFYVVKNKTAMLRLSKMLPNAKMAKDASFLIIPCGDKNKFLKDRDENYWVQDVCLAGENILLAAHALGMGAVWTGVFPMKDRMDTIINTVNISPDHIPLCMIPVGIPAESPEPKNKWKEENIIFR